jgi:hypothetical protein
MALKAGTVLDFAGSMAEAIENALVIEWPRALGVPFPGVGNAYVKVFCAAMAQGVVRHLKDQLGVSLQMSVEVLQTDSLITSRNTTNVFPYFVELLVEQEADATDPAVNKVRSQGRPQVVNVDTTGELH